MTKTVARSAHLVALGTTSWSMWRWFELRSAGFPARRVLALGSDELFAHVQSVTLVDARMREARAAVLAACKLAREADPGNKTIAKVSQRIMKFRDPEIDSEIGAVDAPLHEFRARRAELERMSQELVQRIERERMRNTDELRRIASDPFVREALTWQNREVVHTVIDPHLASSPAEANSKSRKSERLIARYLHRYAVKNDTIGFFGPDVFGVIDPAAGAIEVRHGDTLIKDRVHRFEEWAITALAAQLSLIPGMQAIFKPRRKPFSWLEGSQLMFEAPTPPRPLSATEAFLLQRADGASTAKQIAQAAAADPASELANVDAAYAALAELAKFSFISWAIEIPSDLDDTLRWLRQEIETLEDPVVRAQALAPIGRLEKGLAAVAAAAGDPKGLDLAIEALEKEFVEVTGMPVKRGHGKVYASRQIFYEDTTRNMEIKLGRQVVDDLAGPLSLLLQSARWYTYEAATRFLSEARAIHQAMCERQGTTRVTLGAFLHAIRALFPGDQHTIPPFVATTKADLQARWEDIIGRDRLEAGTSVVHLTTDELRARVAEVFAAPGPGWPRARYSAPDIMLAARDASAIAGGDYMAVLGETHCGANTQLAMSAFRLNPFADAIKAAWDDDMGRPCVAPVPASTNRASHQSISDRDRHVELSWARSRRPREQVHAAGDLVVEARGDRLYVRSRSGDVEYDIVAFMDQFLSNGAVDFHPMAPRPHVPRIVIDKLVIGREQWRFVRADFEEILGHDTDAIAKVMRWGGARKLPRFVFGKVPHEPKPFFVDFASPVTVDIFIRYLGEAQALTLSELLPEFDQLWLADNAGEHFTSELRFVTVDEVAWSPDY